MGRLGKSVEKMIGGTGGMRKEEKYGKAGFVRKEEV